MASGKGCLCTEGTWCSCCAEAVIGISCAVLVLLYTFQRLGTSILGHLFAPIILLWFLAIFCVGVFNIVTWYPGALLTVCHFALVLKGLV